MMDVGELLGGYRIEAVAGAGPTATVYQATQLASDRLVALKVVSTTGAIESHNARERVRRAARNASGLKHDHIIPVLEANEVGAWMYIAMLLVDGPSLADRIDSGALTIRETLRILKPIASAIDAAHAARLVHGDIKPTNILLTANGHPYLTDFGMTGGPHAGSPDPGGAAGGSYASPEQIAGQQMTGASDVYSLAAVLAACLHGTREIDGIVARGTARRTSTRYRSAGELIATCEAAVEDLPAATLDRPVGTRQSEARRPPARRAPTPSSAELAPPPVETSSDERILAPPIPAPAAAPAAPPAPAPAVQPPPAPTVQRTPARAAPPPPAPPAPAPPAPAPPAQAPPPPPPPPAPPPPAPPAPAPPAPAPPAPAPPAPIPARASEPAPARSDLVRERAPLPSRRRAPSTRRRSEASLGRPLAILAIVAVLLVPVLLGYALGGGGEEAPLPTPKPKRSQSASVTVAVPAGWRTAPVEFDGLELVAPIGLRNAAGMELVTGRLRDPASGLDPTRKATRAAIANPTKDVVQIADRSALRYTGAQPQGGSVWLVLLPDTSGWTVVACRAPGSANLDAPCGRVAGTLTPVGATAIEVGPDSGLGETLRAELATLSEARGAAHDPLRADSAKKRGRAATTLAEATRSASDALDDAEVRVQDRTLVAELVRTLAGEATALERLAGAAGRNDRPAYKRRRNAVRRAERKTAGALRALRRGGYEVTVRLS